MCGVNYPGKQAVGHSPFSLSLTHARIGRSSLLSTGRSSTYILLDRFCHTTFSFSVSPTPSHRPWGVMTINHHVISSTQVFTVETYRHGFFHVWLSWEIYHLQPGQAVKERIKKHRGLSRHSQFFHVWLISKLYLLIRSLHNNKLTLREERGIMCNLVFPY